MLKLPHNCTHFTFQQINTQNPSSQALTDVQLDLEKAEEPEIKLPTSVGSQDKAREFQKTPTSASLNTLKPLTVWITTNCGKSLKRWKYQTTLPVIWEHGMQVKKQQLELGMEQLTPNWVTEGCILSPYLFNLYEEYTI